MTAALSLKMAYQHLRTGFGRMVLSVLAVALGVGLVSGMQLMNAAVLHGFLETVDGIAGRAALTVSAGEGLTFAEDVVGKVEAIPGVQLAVPLVRSLAFPTDGSGEMLTIHGVDLTNDAAVRVYHTDKGDKPVDDLLEFIAQADSILLGREFAQQRGLSAGDTIELVTPAGAKRFTIRGLLDAQGLARTLGGRFAVMDLFAAQRAFTVDGQINQIDVVVEHDAEAPAVKAALEATLPPGLRVEEPAVRKDIIRKTVGGFQAMLTAFSFLAILVGFVICLSRLGAVFEARTWEVGLLRAVGLRRSVVFRELLKESLVLGVIGAALGAPLGLLIGLYALPLFATATALNFRIPPLAAGPMVRPGAFVLGALVGLIAALAAAALPALRLARKQPVAALTMRGRETPAASLRIRWPPYGALLVIVVMLLLTQWASDLTSLGMVTTAIMALAACAIAGPLVRLGGPIVKPLWYRMFGLVGSFAVANLGRHARRSALTVGTLGIGLGVVLLFGMLGWSFEQSLKMMLTRRYQADLVVTSAFTSGGYVPAPMAEAVVDEVRAIDGVAVAAGQQYRDLPYDDGSVVISSFDPGCLTNRQVCDWPITPGAEENALEQVARGEAVMVSSSFARRYRTHVGDVVRLESPSGPQAFRVAAVTSGQPEVAVVMGRAHYRVGWNDPHVSWVHVLVGEGVSPQSVETAIVSRLGEKYRLRVHSAPELIEYFTGEVRRAFVALYVMEGVIFLLVVIAISDTLATGVLERTRELGMMRAVGLYRLRLFGIVMLEGAALAFLGIVLAVGTGVTLGAFWVEMQFPALLGWNIALHFPVRFSVIAAVLTVVLCLTGALLPSLRAARLSVPAALRAE